MNVVGIGLDLVEIDRFEQLYGAFDADILSRCFTLDEQSAVNDGPDRLSRLAARFAVKEAVLKTIGGLQDGIALTDINVVSDGVSPPYVVVSGGAGTAADRRGVIGWKISMTHARHSAAAVALAIGADPR